MIYKYMLGMDILNENTICKEDGYYISIDFSETETNFKYDPYIKVYNEENYKSATKVARIYFLNSIRYVPEHKGQKKSILSFSNQELRAICSLLEKYWKVILDSYIYGCNIKDEATKQQIRNNPCPDFYKALSK